MNLEGASGSKQPTLAGARNIGMGLHPGATGSGITEFIDVGAVALDTGFNTWPG